MKNEPQEAAGGRKRAAARDSRDEPKVHSPSALLRPVFLALRGSSMTFLPRSDIAFSGPAAPFRPLVGEIFEKIGGNQVVSRGVSLCMFLSLIRDLDSPMFVPSRHCFSPPRSVTSL